MDIFYNAIFNNDLDKVKSFLERGIELNNIDNYGRIPIMNAIYYDTYTRSNDKIIKGFLNHGADINIVDEYLHTPLMKTVLYSNTKLCELLFKIMLI